MSRTSNRMGRLLCAGSLAGAVAATLLVPCVGAHAQPLDREAFANGFAASMRERYGSDSNIDEEIRRSWGSGLSERQIELLREHARVVVFHPRYADYAATLAAKRFNRSSPLALLQRLNELPLRLMERGLLRLPASLQAESLMDVRDALASLGVEECNAFLTAPHPDGARFVRAITALPPQRFESYVRRLTASAVAELDDAPMAPEVDAQLAAEAHAQARLAMRMRLRAKLSSDARRNLGSGVRGVSAPDPCTLATESANAVLELDEPFRSVEVRALLRRSFAQRFEPSSGTQEGELSR